jgi:hypothetical protein
MTLATLIASIAIVLDSQILVIGAMVSVPSSARLPPSAWRRSGAGGRCSPLQPACFPSPRHM